MLKLKILILVVPLALGGCAGRITFEEVEREPGTYDKRHHFHNFNHSSKTTVIGWEKRKRDTEETGSSEIKSPKNDSDES